jgi:hypothetical protein
MISYQVRHQGPQDEGGIAVSEELDDSEPFVGEWRMTPRFVPDVNDASRARTRFEWLPGRRFLIQRWDVEHPDAPDGIAIIGVGHGTSAYLQHYFDSRGVARTYSMEFSNGVWTLQRIAEDPDFSQRFIGRFGEGGSTIVGTWESSSDQGLHWSPDFELTYTQLE